MVHVTQLCAAWVTVRPDSLEGIGLGCVLDFASYNGKMPDFKCFLKDGGQYRLREHETQASWLRSLRIFAAYSSMAYKILSLSPSPPRPLLTNPWPQAPEDLRLSLEPTSEASELMRTSEVELQSMAGNIGVTTRIIGVIGYILVLYMR